MRRKRRSGLARKYEASPAHITRDEIILRNVPQINDLIRRSLRGFPSEVIEDVAHDAIVRFIQRTNTLISKRMSDQTLFDKNAPLIAKSTVIDYLRKHGTKNREGENNVKTLTNHDFESIRAEKEIDTESRSNRARARNYRFLLKFKSILNDKEWDLLEMAFIDCYSPSEMAEMLRMSKSSVSNRIGAIRDKIERIFGFRMPHLNSMRSD